MKEVDFDVAEIRKAIEESTETTSIYVGADSKKCRDNVVYATVVVLHFDSKHGGKIFKDIKIEPYYGSVRQKLMFEVYKAADIAYKIMDVVGARRFQIHLDLNPNKDQLSNIVVKEATGYILGTVGFAPTLKPDAFAASTAADEFAVKNAKFGRKFFRKRRNKKNHGG
ncbi:MAG: hypothetical protein BV459_03280 [Thermoplasmata archaeon M11B2D]|nr:MAG: hypothetical protein BV459_03280 [Thermoplasmata archaeon M11B2D]